MLFSSCLLVFTADGGEAWLDFEIIIEMFLAIVSFYTLYNYSPVIPIVFSSWRPSQRAVSLSQNVKGANNLLRGFIRNMFDIETQQEQHSRRNGVGCVDE